MEEGRAVLRYQGGRALLRAIRLGIRDSPTNWILQRSRVPGVVVTVATIAIPAYAGLGAGAILAINWVVGQIPTYFTFVRAFTKRDPLARERVPGERTGLWTFLRERDWSYWTRPQSHQGSAMGDIPLEAMESDPRATGAPRWVRGLTNLALDQTRPVAVRKTAAFVDDWLNMRSIVPGILISLGFLALGAMWVPAAVLFSANWILSGVPNILAGYMAWKNHDLKRITMPGWWQRKDQILRRKAPATQREMAIGKGVVLEEEQPGIRFLARVIGRRGRDTFRKEQDRVAPHAGGRGGENEPMAPGVGPGVARQTGPTMVTGSWGLSQSWSGKTAVAVLEHAALHGRHTGHKATGPAQISGGAVPSSAEVGVGL